MVEGTVPGAVVCVALASMFTGVALRDFLLAAGKRTTARTAWLCSSFIFSGVAIGLFVWQPYLV